MKSDYLADLNPRIKNNKLNIIIWKKNNLRLRSSSGGVDTRVARVKRLRDLSQSVASRYRSRSRITGRDAEQNGETSEEHFWRSWW